MKRAIINTLFALPALALISVISSSHEGSQNENIISLQNNSKYIYTGLEKCAKKCHQNGELGFQYDIIKNSPHAEAYNVLSTRKAEVYARQAKVEGSAAASPVCLKCHVTGGGLDASYFAATYKKEDGVTCEACHKGQDNAQTVLPGEKSCLECHANTVHKVAEFDYKERFAKIAHPKAAVVVDTNRNNLKKGMHFKKLTGGSGKHYLGEHFGGGIVFFTTDDGMHGLIAAAADQGKGIKWHNGVSRFTGSDDDGYQAGAHNTEKIAADLARDDSKGHFAAGVCADYSITVNGIEYNDWYLPSKSELNLMYLQKDIIGGFARGYWSSTEVDSTRAWGQYFSSGRQFSHGGKDYAGYVRAIRAF